MSDHIYVVLAIFNQKSIISFRDPTSAKCVPFFNLIANAMPPLQEDPILLTFSTHQEEDFDINRWTGKLIKPITIIASNCVFETVASTETIRVQAEVWGTQD